MFTKPDLQLTMTVATVLEHMHTVYTAVYNVGLAIISLKWSFAESEELYIILKKKTTS